MPHVHGGPARSFILGAALGCGVLSVSAQGLPLQMTLELKAPEPAPDTVAHAGEARVVRSLFQGQPSQPPQPAHATWAVDFSHDQTLKHGASTDFALTWALGNDLDDSGGRFRLAANHSLYRYAVDPIRRQVARGRSDQVELLAGWSQVVGRYTWMALTGYAWARSVEPGSESVTDSSVKSVLSVYAQPTDGTQLYSALAHTHRVKYTQWLLKWGLAASPGGYWGPELKADWRGDGPWRAAPAQRRLGVQWSSVKVGDLWWGLSLGHIDDKDIGEGSYLSLGAYGSY